MGGPVVNPVPSASQRLLEHALVPVIRTSSTDLAANAVHWLERAGYTVFELTLTIPGALDLIAELRRDERFLVGAGTVRSAAEADACLAAGAQFIVSPYLAEDLVPTCRAAAAPVVLGALTPTEVARASALGAAAVKVFPAGSVGGPAHLRALRSVFPEVALIPTGGVDLGNLSDYFAAGAAAVGIGTDLISDRLVRGADPDAWIERARSYLHRGREARNAHIAASATGTKEPA